LFVQIRIEKRNRIPKPIPKKATQYQAMRGGCQASRKAESSSGWISGKLRSEDGIVRMPGAGKKEKSGMTNTRQGCRCFMNGSS
jgi:hypothetical protein